MAILTGRVLWCQCCRKRRSTIQSSADDQSLPASLPAGPPAPPQSIMVGLTEEQFGELLRKVMDRTMWNAPIEEDCNEENDCGKVAAISWESSY